MEFPPDLVTPGLEWTGQVLFWPLFGWVVWCVRRGKSPDTIGSHVFLGSCVAVLVAWQLRAGVPPAPPVHLLGTTLLCLMFGPGPAMLGIVGILAATTVHGGGWPEFGLNALLLGGLPIAATEGLRRWVRHRLPRNPFVYIFLVAFGNAAAAVALVGAVSGAVLVLASPLDLDYVMHMHWAAYLLLLFPEAFVTGGVVTLLVVYRPGWIRSYREDYAPRW